MRRLERIGIVMRMTFFEAMRRKDMYAVLTLAFVFIACIGCIRFYGVDGFDDFFRDMALAITNFALAVILVVVTARQFPLDLESRMIHPVLSRGVSRREYVLGKFAGCCVVGVFTLSVLHIQLLLALGLFGVPPGFSLPEVLFLRLVTSGVIVGMTFFFSQFLRLRVNVAVSVLVCAAMTLGSFGVRFATFHFEWLSDRAVGLLSVAAPHLRLFDVTSRAGILGRSLSPGDLAVLTLHGTLYVTLFLAGSQYLLARRKL